MFALIRAIIRKFEGSSGTTIRFCTNREIPMNVSPSEKMLEAYGDVEKGSYTLQIG